MFRKFFRFLFFIAISIAAFILVHVKNNALMEYLNAAMIGAVAGLILFIAFSLLFPVKKKVILKSGVDDRNGRNNRNVRRSSNIERQRPNRRVERRPSNRDRRYQDTDKIRIDGEIKK